MRRVVTVELKKLMSFTINCDYTMHTHVSKFRRNTSDTLLMISAFTPPKKTALTKSTWVKVKADVGGGPWPVVGGTLHSPVCGSDIICSIPWHNTPDQESKLVAENLEWGSTIKCMNASIQNIPMPSV